MGRLGKLKLFHSTMNGSKSANLLMQIHNFERQGKFVIAFKPTADTRDDEIRSRAIQESHSAYSIRNYEVGLMTSIVAKNSHNNISRIFIDEIQFFSAEQIKEIAQIAIEFGIDVYTYGLLNSYTGKVFPAIVKAIECGFSLEEMKMQCDMCENRATNHILLSDGCVIKGDEAKIHIGDEEFLSLCYKCYLEQYSK